MMKTKGQLRYRAYFGDIEKVEALGPHEVKFTFRQGAAGARPPADRRRHLDLLQGLLRGPRLLPRLHGPAARLRPLPGRPRRRRPHGGLPPRPRLLGQGPAGERRRQQLRRDPHRLLRRPGQRLRGLQGRRVHLPRRDQRRPLADRLRLPGEAARRRRHRRDPRPHRPLRRRRLLQPAPRGLAGPRASGRRSRPCSTSSGSTPPSSTASSAAARATGSAATWWRPARRPPTSRRCSSRSSPSSPTTSATS